MAHVQRRVEMWERSIGSLDPWDRAVFGERGHGPAVVPWDGRFRSVEEFEMRWATILDATTRDWVNLDLVGLRDRTLILFVEYLTDDHVTRTWATDKISINGSAQRDPVTERDAAW